jgi:hypothetical protein
LGSDPAKMMKKIKNQTEIQDLIESVGSRTSLTQDQVMFALELALEQSVCEYFDLADCQVDVENKILMPNSYKGDMIDRLDHDIDSIRHGFDFEILHKNIIDRCRQLLSRNLIQMENAYLYEKWKRKVHQAVEGVIHEVGSEKVMIHLGGNVLGIMTKSEWVPKEISLYQKGSALWFYVSKVLQDKSAVTAYLSRGSKNFPAAILKEKLPWMKITAIKRFRGVKTYLKTDTAIDSNIIKELQRELKGEVIDVQTI